MKKILGLIQLFVGVSSLTGSIPMLIEKAQLAENAIIQSYWESPFSQGLLLLVLIAIPNLIGSYLSLNNQSKSGHYGAVVSLLLIVWTLFQIKIINGVNTYLFFYFVIAFGELFLSVRLIKIARKKNI